MRGILGIALGLVAVTAVGAEPPAAPSPQAWPPLTRDCRPWAYWWWHGSAVNPADLTRELTRYRQAGMGGVHIIPIYRVKGCADQEIEYLSPTWMQMLRHTVSEGQRLDLGIDMTTGTGWCFGGPNVSDADANSLLVSKVFDVAAGAVQRYLGRFSAAFEKYDGPRPRASYHDSYEYRSDWSPETYRVRFEAPDWRLDLGRVCQSARVRLHGRDLGTLFTPAFRTACGPLQPRDNMLEVEVTNVAANASATWTAAKCPGRSSRTFCANCPSSVLRLCHPCGPPLTNFGAGLNRPCLAASAALNSL
jgi:hypothetical protein